MNLSQNLRRAIESQKSELARRVVESQFAHRADLVIRFGEQAREKCLADCEYHLSYLAEAIAAKDATLFSDYLAWAKIVLASRGIPVADLVDQVSCLQEQLIASFPIEWHEPINEIFSAALATLPNVATEIPTELPVEEPYSELVRQFLQLLLTYQRGRAGQLVHQALEQDVSLKAIYLQVLQPSQREIGRLWQSNEISVAQEHYCSAATQLIMAQLYPHVLEFAAEDKSSRIVVTCVEDELHEIGARMVADFFEMSSWDAVYLGANTPSRDVLQMAASTKPDLLAVSATMTIHLRQVAELVNFVRGSQDLQGIPILVGGCAFNQSQELWQKVGADGYATDAEQAVALANQLL